MMELIAQAQDGGSVSVTAVTAIIGAIFTGLALLLGKSYGEKKAQKVRVEPNPLSVAMVERLATKEQLEEVEEQLEGRISRVEQGALEDRRILRDMEGKTHARIDKMAEGLSGVQGEMRQMNANMRALLERQMKGGTGR